MGSESVRVGEVEHSEFTGSHTHIDHDELAREVGSIAELIANESGIQFRQAGGTGTFSSITVRGATAAQTNVYFDGILLNDASSGGVDLSQLELLNLASIDIYRGATPVQLGVASIGGAVNLHSRKVEGNASRVLAGYGSFRDYHLQLGHQTKQDDWDASIAVTHRQADNEFEFVNENGTPLNPLDDPREKRINAEFSRSGFLFKVGKKVSRARRYDGSLQYSDRRQGIPHWRNRADSQTSLDTGSLQLQLNRRNFALAGKRWSHTQGVYLNRNTEHYDDRFGQTGLGKQNTENETLVLGGRAYWEAVRDNGTLALNLDVRREALEQQDLLGSNNYSATRYAANGAMQYSLFKFDEKLLLTPSLRFQGIEDDYNGVVREGKNNRSNSKITPQVGLRYQFNESLQVTSNLGQHHREPVFFELFGDRGFYVGNDRLVPEEGINLDVGLHWQSPQNGERSASLTAFAGFRNDQIVSVYDARNIGRSENSGKARVVGIEGTANWQWSKQWRARVSVTAQSAENRSGNAAFQGKQLPGEARLVTFARVDYRAGSWSAWYEGDIVRDRFYDSPNLLPAENQFIHNIGLGFTRRQLKSTLALKNINDDNAEDFKGFSKPGRSFHFNLTYTFKGARS